ncbi:hypothetical protein LOTGIDRAFT_167104 [Lottia gigantea]|uniref:Uncharacterized protein n=1 Tax=Lottia gigantea TaxID=225164 RepID=V3ZVF5_LOTGI|nr:hypothetical protein LOTGIDRAFT_167104 [Lottia gigantea]ESO86580.1 hypothetical protein LOTGIDRAFT_167104 [Lottia gigantea]
MANSGHAKHTYNSAVKRLYPEIYRKWRWNVSDSKSDDVIDFQNLETQECPNCYSDLSMNNCQIRLKPKMKLTASLKKLIKKSKVEKNKLSKKQKHLVDLYTNSKNNIVLKCLSCSKSIKFPGISRPQIINQRLKFKVKNTAKEDSMSPSIIHNKQTKECKINDKAQSKKKKKKMQNQSLQFILSQEKRKKSGETLKDFLSSVR